MREMRCFTLLALAEFRLCCPLTYHLARNLPEFWFHVEISNTGVRQIWSYNLGVVRDATCACRTGS